MTQNTIQKVYISGPLYGPCGEGNVVMARRNSAPSVLAKEYYIISGVVSYEQMGACGKNLLVTLDGLEGEYHKSDFKRNSECLLREGRIW